MSTSPAPIAITAGDPSGIGPEILLDLWRTRGRDGTAPFFLIADPSLLAARAKLVGIEVPQAVIARPADAIEAIEAALPVLPLGRRFVDRPGVAEPANAPGIVEAIDRAVDAVLAGDASAIVTGPIAKASLYEAGFAYPGHTEYLAHLAEQRLGTHVTPVMMLAGPELRAVPVTIHVPLSAVPGLLNVDLIVETGRIVERDLRERFGLSRPRLAIAGLNPHAGEEGAMGTEEITVIRPAVERLRASGIEATGPLAADTLFHAQARTGYDAAICMYHDQALIAAKTLAFDETVNVTLGLPFIRTSPDHGTAFAIAGTGTARPDSFRAALVLAGEMVGRRSA